MTLKPTERTKAFRDAIAKDWKKSPYYDNAEKSARYFWREDGLFRPLFNYLDLETVVELASGHGRHVPYYLGMASNIVLVDINSENIDFCRDRFSEETKIDFLVNDGSFLEAIRNNSVSSIFCYDAMVHFELFDVNSYINEAFRILKPGGYALYHHSNYTGGPQNEYRQNPHWRNFMSAEIFAYLSSRAGMTVVKQKIIDWGAGEKKRVSHDCISLIKKP